MSRNVLSFGFLESQQRNFFAAFPLLLFLALLFPPLLLFIPVLILFILEFFFGAVLPLMAPLLICFISLPSPRSPPC